jgi:hypothetical protein
MKPFGCGQRGQPDLNRKLRAVFPQSEQNPVSTHVSNRWIREEGTQVHGVLAPQSFWDKQVD